MSYKVIIYFNNLISKDCPVEIEKVVISSPEKESENHSEK